MISLPPQIKNSIKASMDLMAARRLTRSGATLLIGSPELATSLQAALGTDHALYHLTPKPQSMSNTAAQAAIAALFERIRSDRQTLDLVIFQPAAATPHATADLTAGIAEERWQDTGYLLFHIAQAAIQQMLKSNHGSLIVLGSNLAQTPQSNLALDTAMYAGMRALCQSLAREFHPQGLHISYVALPEPVVANASDLAQLCLQLHRQPQSVWTQEVGMG